jgi:pyrroline-5-carboxylate reductase
VHIEEVGFPHSPGRFLISVHTSGTVTVMVHRSDDEVDRKAIDEKPVDDEEVGQGVGEGVGEETVDIVMIGGGNMGAALVEGMIGSGQFSAGSLAIVERLADRREQLVSMFPGTAVVDEIPPCAAAVIAVKPDAVSAAVVAAVAAGARRVLSIAAGVTIATLEQAAGGGVVVIRSMPNTPALVGRGVAAIAGGETAEELDLDWAEQILGSVGTVERLDESLLDAFTGVAGSGPAYVFLFAEALIDAAVGEGIPRTVAERVVSQLLLGSSMLLDQRGDATQLRVNVTSPGGTTAAGLARFDAHDFRAIVAEVVAAATDRSRELA